MAIQSVQHFGCSLHRTHKDLIKYYSEDFYELRSEACFSIKLLNAEKNLSVCIIRPETGIGKYSIKNGRYRLIGAESCQDNSTCRLEFAKDIIYRGVNRALRIYRKWSSALLIYFLPIIMKIDEEFEPFCKAMYESAIQIRTHGSSLLVVAPYSQHFHHPRGLYTPDVNVAKGESQCVPIQESPLSEHPDSRRFRQTMDRLYPNWRQVLGFYDPGPLSAPFHDIHPEISATGWKYDCTHFANSPFLLQSLWYDLGKYVPNHYKNKTFVG